MKTDKAPGDPQRGRPKRGSGSIGLNVSVSHEERALIHAEAQLIGVDPSRLMRGLFLAWRSGEPLSKVPEEARAQLRRLEDACSMS